jgi:formylglycine-generating enzyme required for sulfatase activity
MLMVYVPRGDFLMGNRFQERWRETDYPQHMVFLDAYWIDMTEVTNAMFRLCVDAGECERPRIQDPERDHPCNIGNPYDDPAYDNYPVINVDWLQARNYCQWAGRRLPSEAEWEKAARGTRGQAFPWGDALTTGDQMNFCDSSCMDPFFAHRSIDDGYENIAPVGSFPLGASPYGALDMAGNVQEWVADWAGRGSRDDYSDRYLNPPTINPTGPATGTHRMHRGCSWGDNPNGCEVYHRNMWPPDYAWWLTGFRCAQSE